MGDWVRVKWTGKIDSTGREVENSEHTKQGNSHLFRLGHYEVAKCWDMAIMQMKAGEKANVKCPAHFDHRGTESVNNYPYKGDEWIKGGSDMTYEIEVKSCGRDNVEKAIFDWPLDGKRCFFFTTAQVKSHDKVLALAPGLKNVGDSKGEKYKLRVVPFDQHNRDLKWWFDTRDSAVHSYGPHDDMVLAETPDH